MAGKNSVSVQHCNNVTTITGITSLCTADMALRIVTQQSRAVSSIVCVKILKTAY